MLSDAYHSLDMIIPLSILGFSCTHSRVFSVFPTYDSKEELTASHNSYEAAPSLEASHIAMLLFYSVVLLLVGAY